MSEQESKKTLKEMGLKIVSQLDKGKNPEIIFPLRNLSNIIYDKKTKTLKLGNKKGSRTFFNVAHAKKFLQTIEVASVIKKNLLDTGLHASLRDVYYSVKRTIYGTNINIIDDQIESDKCIEDLEVMTELSREQMHVNADKKGSIVGNVIIEDSGDIIDWSKLGSGGWSIPSNVEEIKFKKVNADYILYMEKAAVWERLNEDKFWKKHNCIIIASQGQTTRGIRRLLQRFYEGYKLPIYVMTDLDPWGFWIYAVIKYGSINLAYASERLTIPSVKFLGITTDDIEKYGLSKQLIKFKDNDFTRLKQISEYEWFKDNKEWQRQFTMLKKMGAKAEIQALSAQGITFISEKYLPEKIKKKEFLD